MTLLEPPPSLGRLLSASTSQEHLSALKQIRNDIIGHEQRKEAIIRHGVVECLARGFRGSGKGRGKRRSYRHHQDEGLQLLDIEDEVRIQCTHIVTSLAHCGPHFLPPLFAGNVVTHLLETLQQQPSPSRLVVEVLRALSVVAKSLWEETHRDYQPLQNALADMLFARPSINLFAQILAQQNISPMPTLLSEQILLILHIFGRAGSHAHRYGNACIKAGILDLLASMLSAFVPHYSRAVEPQALELVDSPSHPPKIWFVPLLDAITSLIKESPYRTARFLYSRDVLTLFPTTGIVRADLEEVLPSVSSNHSKSDHTSSKSYTTNFKPQAFDLQNMGVDISPSLSLKDLQSEDLSGSLAQWLIAMARKFSGLERLSTLWLLSHLLHCSELNGVAQRILALLVVPILVHTIEETNSNPNDRFEEGCLWNSVRERLPFALSLVIDNSNCLQFAAVDSNAIKAICLILKKSFDPVWPGRKGMWSPVNADKHLGPTSTSSSYMLGPPGTSPELLHCYATRTASLQAISSLAQKHDVIRKELVKNGVISCIVDTLKSCPCNDHQSQQINASESMGKLNSTPSFVLTAALRAVMALSRSVGILRTNLIDGGVAMPIFELLRHDDIVVRRAATDSSVNLVLPFSPMRAQLMQAGILPILCEQAHSIDPDLRISSFWALKNLVTQAPSEIKARAFGELGAGFITQMLAGDLLATPHKTQLATPNALGEKVDLLNAVDEADMDVDNGCRIQFPGECHDNEESSPESSKKYGLAEGHEWLLNSIRDAEESPLLRSRRCEISVQHHVLDFLSNLMSDPNSQVEIVEQVLHEMGTIRLFDIILQKLKPRALTSSSTAGKRPTLTTVSSGSSKSYIDPTTYANSDILQPALTILVHVANGRPMHRHLLISHQNLLHTILPLFSHPNHNIRLRCVWLVINILWVEDAGDRETAKQRAQELRVCGIHEACQKIYSKDDSTDASERAKAVLETFAKLIPDTAGTSGTHSAGRVWD